MPAWKYQNLDFNRITKQRNDRASGVAVILPVKTVGVMGDRRTVEAAGMIERE